MSDEKKHESDLIQALMNVWREGEGPEFIIGYRGEVYGADKRRIWRHIQNGWAND